MRLNVKVESARVFGTFGKDMLEIVCKENYGGEGRVTLIVKDHSATRRAYPVGRVIDIEVMPL